MADVQETSGSVPPWKSSQAPCVYCGQLVDRTTDRCPHCRTSFSLAVRKASREVIGPWYYLDPRNPSGRGVTFETLIKMIEKGRIKPDSIVRGPTTHQDWMYAAETPRLAKYLGMCPHCFAEAKPEDTYCARCQLNMNTRPGEPRPGVPPDLVKEPFHRAAHEIEKELAKVVPVAEEPLVGDVTGARPAVVGPAGGVAPAAAVLATAPAPPAAKAEPTPTPSAAAVAAAAAVADTAAAGAERKSRIAAASRARKPSLWLVLILTWVTLIPVVLICIFTDVPLWLVPGSWEDSVQNRQDRVRGALGFGPSRSDAPAASPTVSEDWVRTQLAEADKAEQAKDYDGAIRIFREIVSRTGDTSFNARIDAIQEKARAERKARETRLKERLELAGKMADEDRFDDALAVLRSIGPDDRKWLASLGLKVEEIENNIRADQAAWQKQKQQEDQLLALLAQAGKLHKEKKLQEALDAYNKIGATFPADLLKKHIDLDKTLRDLQTQMAAASTPATPTAPPPTTPTTPTTPSTPTTPATPTTPDASAAMVADLMNQAQALEKAEKFAEALAKLEEIKTKADPKLWPPNLDERIKQVKAKKEALEFFGVDKKPKPPAKGS